MDRRTDRRTDGQTDGGDNIPNTFSKKRGDNNERLCAMQCQTVMSLIQDSNPGPCEAKSEALTTWPFGCFPVSMLFTAIILENPDICNGQPYQPCICCLLTESLTLCMLSNFACFFVVCGFF